MEQLVGITIVAEIEVVHPDEPDATPAVEAEATDDDEGES